MRSLGTLSIFDSLKSQKKKQKQNKTNKKKKKQLIVERNRPSLGLGGKYLVYREYIWQLNV